MRGPTDLELSACHLRLVRAILDANLPNDAKVWVFGSRATRRARRYSDLDLAIDAGRPVMLDEFARLADAFRESDLPYNVDIVDWQVLDDRFRRIIAEERVCLPDPGSAPPATMREGST